MTSRAQQSTYALILDVVRQAAGLLEKEVVLAKTEVSENISRAGLAIGLMLGAAVMAMTCLNLLAGSLVSVIVEAGLTPGWASLMVAGGFAICAAAILGKALRELRAASLMPTQTMENIRKDAQTVSQTVSEATHA